MATCHTCKHWAPPPCAADKDFGVCAAVHDGWLEREQAPSDACKAFVEDVSGFEASLYTKPDFGCVLFEDKRP